MTALEINADNAALPDIIGHSVSHSPWGYHATTVGGKRKNKTKQHKQKQKQKQGGKSNKNKRRSRYTRQKQNKLTRKQRK
jgi:hypothetical protein